MEVLFKGPLNEATEVVKCNYVIYWGRDHGMDLVDKWTAEGKINDRNKETLNTYWGKFEEYIHPQTNQLIAGYEGDAKDQVLRDTIISGIASEKIRAKIVKEGHKVTLN